MKGNDGHKDHIIPLDSIVHGAPSLLELVIVLPTGVKHLSTVGIGVEVHLVREPQPDRHALRRESVLEVRSDGVRKAAGHLCPLDLGHQRRDQDRSGGDDVRGRVLIVAVVGPGVDVA